MLSTILEKISKIFPINSYRWRFLGYIVFPLVNQHLAKTRTRLYHYEPSTDRLFLFDSFGPRFPLWLQNPKIDSDQWCTYLPKLSLRKGIMFDVGVNFGYSTSWLARYASHVYAFEPNPQNVDFIKEHFLIRNIQNAEVLPCAVSDRDGFATLHVKPRHGHHSLGDIGASKTIERMRVPTVTLDTFAAERGIETVAFIKVDVEGYEPEVFRGASTLLQEQRIDMILFEYTPAFYRERSIDEESPIHILKEFGYSVTDLDGHEVTQRELARLGQTDLLANSPQSL